jgi:hypothetical protein
MPLLIATPPLILFSQSHGAHGAKGLCLQSDYRHGSGTYAHCGKANASKTSQFEGQYNGLYVDKSEFEEFYREVSLEDRDVFYHSFISLFFLHL